MSESPRVSTDFSSPVEETSLNQYTHLGGWGFLSLFFGTFALLALFGPTWWVCGGLGFLGCTLTTIHLNRQQPSTTVRVMAVTGLCLSLLAISYAPTQYYLREMAITQQSALFGTEWVKNILTGKPYRALAALTDPEIRLSEKQLKTYYLKTSKGLKELKQFENKSLVKCLLDLNGRARTNFYQTESVRIQGQDQIIASLFSVSYLETPLEKKTFFVRLVMKRTAASGTGQWSILRYRGGVRPRTGIYSKSKPRPGINSSVSIQSGVSFGL